MWLSRGGAGAMVHGRIETTPQEQLEELRRAHARYIRLADELKDNSESDPGERKAREEDARRIAHAYERTIANTAARMASLGQARAGTPFIAWAMAAGLGLVVVAAAGVGFLAFTRTAVFHVRPDRPKPVAQTASGAVPVDRSQAGAFAAPEPESPSEMNAIAPSAPAAPKPPPPEIVKQNIQTGKAVTAPKSDVPPQVPPPSAAIPQAAPPSRDLIQPPSASTAPSSDAQAASPPSIAATTVLPLPNAVRAPPPSASQAPSSTVPGTPTTPINSGTPTDSSLPVSAAPPPLSGATQAPPPAIVPETPVQTQTLPPIAAAVPPPRQQPKPANLAPVQLEPVRNTHVPPPYPAMSERLGEQGTTRMQVSISAQGLVTECKVTDSSGSDRLDTAACSYVQQRWRWKPPMRGGRPVTADTEISVIWSLRRAP